MDIRAEMLRQVRSRRDGFSLQQPFYIDPDYYKLDLELIWYRDWLFVGHDCELPKTGSYMTLQVGDYPVVVVRDQKGDIRAFHNSCRHRGSRVCTAHKGTAAKLVCPYHQWTYELDGRLLFARQMGPDFDPSGFGLKPVACESVAGYVFICLADQPADFAPMRAMVEPFSRRTASPRPRSPSKAPLLKKATGSWCGKTTASATTAPATIPNSARPSRSAHRHRRQRCRERPRNAGALGEVRGARPAQPLPHR